MSARRSDASGDRKSRHSAYASRARHRAGSMARRQPRIVQSHPPIFVDQQGAHDISTGQGSGRGSSRKELDDPAKAAADETPVTGIEAHQVPVLPAAATRVAPRRVPPLPPREAARLPASVSSAPTISARGRLAGAGRSRRRRRRRSRRIPPRPARGGPCRARVPPPGDRETIRSQWPSQASDGAA